MREALKGACRCFFAPLCSPHCRRRMAASHDIQSIQVEKEPWHQTVLRILPHIINRAISYHFGTGLRRPDIAGSIAPMDGPYARKAASSTGWWTFYIEWDEPQHP